MIKRILTEPLFHFALLGAAIFVAFRLMSGPAAPTQAETARIVFDEADIAQLVAQYREVWRRPPTEQELAALVDRQIDQAVMVREARALGLDRNDPVIDNRLQQKMTFLAASLAQSMDPGDEVLAAHMAENVERFTAEARISFDQVFLGPAPDAATVERIRTALEAGEDPGTLGERSLLPNSVSGQGRTAVDGTLGTGVFDRFAALPAGTWAGPVETGYGLHLVRVTDLAEDRPLTLEEARDKVLFDWRRASAETLTEAQLADLRSRYEIAAPDAETLRRALAE
jgi:hypothetical protein